MTEAEARSRQKTTEIEILEADSEQSERPEIEILAPGETSREERKGRLHEQFAYYTETLKDDTSRLEILEHILDRAFVIPGTNIRFGIDPILGFVPVIGDTLSAVISLYVLNEARRMRLPWWKRGLMVKNIGADWLIGLIPFFGDLLDIGVRSNTKNVRILKEHLKKNKDINNNKTV